MEMGNQEWNSGITKGNKRKWKWETKSGITKKWKWSEALSFERKVLSPNESFCLQMKGGVLFIDSFRRQREHKYKIRTKFTHEQ
jgi:hypothetical protein